ncbi:hypothetical protein C8246_12700 [Paracidovorax avenae]|uniref:PAAR domain-containing protein n=1 Tax=Paracidovorax avenae TaxID=80867 RepID=UPI000D21DBCB|nr:PAAR domain-containing protein [Paracidovorax avenae]AVS76846.1 hypothetical protein C8234_01420 [Paracidovorax avenae]AVS92504.1 hypothetical protein C8246_12700 [Paracidovorax avenae]
MGQPAARIGDEHVCPVHGAGPLVTGCTTVLIGGLPAARITDKAVCPMGPPDLAVEGEATVLIGGLPAARMGDRMAHGGLIAMGCPTVLIGANAGECLAEAARSGAAFVSALE